jgi:sec-independent protein translocase protein TatB
MFDLFDGPKLIIIGIVMLVMIPPKDLPGVMRQIGKSIAQLRRMAAEFQGQFNDAMREAELHDLKKDVEKMTKLDDYGLDAFNSLRDDINTAKADIDAKLNTPASPPIEPAPGNVTGDHAAEPAPAADPVVAAHDEAPRGEPAHTGAVRT